MRKGTIIWTEWISSLFIVAAVTLVFIVLNQAWEYTLYDEAVENGVDATNLSYIDSMWELWPMPVIIALILSMIRVSRRGYQYVR